MDILEKLKDVVTGEMEEKIEAAAAPLAEKMPEEIIDGAEDMIQNATGMNFDLNQNESPEDSTVAE